MRIISQDGAIDLPYGIASFAINKKTFEIEAFVNEKFEPVMGMYSSLDKCSQAMSLLQDSYASHFFV